MKKILIGILTILLIVLLCACGSKAGDTQSAPAPAVSPAETQPSQQSADLASNYIGNWYVDVEKSGVEKCYTLFGSSFRDYGSELSIGDELINFYIGATGGNGKYTFKDGVFTANLVDFNEKQNVTYEIKVFNENSSVYLTQAFPDGDGVFTVYWTKTAPNNSAIGTPAPNVVYIVNDPNETPVPSTPTPEVVYIVSDPKQENTNSSAAVKDVYLKTLSTFETQYSSIVNLYQKAISEKWTVDDCYSNNINYLIGLMNQNGTSDKIGYCYGDVNGDGIDELIIGEDNQIYAMYTLVNNQPKMVVDAGERSAYYLEPDGIIVNSGSSSAFLSAYTFYKLNNGELVVNNALVSDFSANEKEPWYYATDDDWDVSNDKKLSTEKAEQWIKAYRDNYITFPFIPLVYN